MRHAIPLTAIRPFWPAIALLAALSAGRACAAEFCHTCNDVIVLQSPAPGHSQFVASISGWQRKLIEPVVCRGIAPGPILGCFTRLSPIRCRAFTLTSELAWYPDSPAFCRRAFVGGSMGTVSAFSWTDPCVQLRALRL